MKVGRVVAVMMMLLMKWLVLFFGLLMDHGKEGVVVELAVAVLRGVCFGLGFGHEVGEHGDFGGSGVEVVILLLRLLRIVCTVKPA